MVVNNELIIAERIASSLVHISMKWHVSMCNADPVIVNASYNDCFSFVQVASKLFHS